MPLLQTRVAAGRRDFTGSAALPVVVSGAEAGPKRREMRPRFWGGGTEAEAWTAAGVGGGQFSGCWVGACRALGAAAAVEGEGREGYSGGCGVLGLELAGEAPLGGTMGDWQPEEGLRPLVGPGEE